MSAITISITRNLGGDTVRYETEAPSTTAALILVAALTGQDVPAISDHPVGGGVDAKKPTAAAASSANGAKPESTDKKDAAPAVKSKAKVEEQPEVNYEDVKAKILPLAQAKGRDTVVALLQRHGVAKAPDLKPAQWAAVIADIDAINDGTYDPEASEALA